MDDLLVRTKIGSVVDQLHPEFKVFKFDHLNDFYDNVNVLSTFR